MNIVYLFILMFLVNTANAKIPLPGQYATQDKGLMSGLGFGVLSHASCKTMWNWQARVDYAYNPNISGGAGINFFGGNLDSANNLVIQRYIISGQYIHSQTKFAMLIGPMLTFDNTDLRELYKEWQRNRIQAITECHEIFGTIGSSVGYHSGIGRLFTESFGINLGHKLSVTFDGSIIYFFSGALAFNLRNYFERFESNTKNFWLSLEYYYMSIETRRANIHGLLLGLNLGF